MIESIPTLTVVLDRLKGVIAIDYDNLFVYILDSNALVCKFALD
jgi:hypothetical protein